MLRSSFCFLQSSSATVKVATTAASAGVAASSSSSSSSSRRRMGSRQPDIAEWCRQHSAELRELRKARLREAPGVLTYLGYGRDFVTSWRTAKKERKEKEAKAAASPTAAEEDENAGYNPDSAVNQHLRSQEITRRFKWNKVSWDVGADFDGFSNRMMNSDVANKVPALSHLRIHLLKDRNNTSNINNNNNAATDTVGNTSTSAASVEASQKKKKLSTYTNNLKPGDITNWFFQEVDESAPLVPFARDGASITIRSPFRVDWETGEVFILDTASADEVHSFLRGPAHALQTLQARHSDDETALTADVDNTRIYLNAFVVKYNEYDRAYYSDVTRRKNPRAYVDPPEVKKFCRSVWNNSLVLKHYLRDQHIRILPPGQPYRIDPETREVCIPADFDEYNTSSIHGLARPFQSIVVKYRATIYLWCLLGLLAMGDTEFL